MKPILATIALLLAMGCASPKPHQGAGSSFLSRPVVVKPVLDSRIAALRDYGKLHKIRWRIQCDGDEGYFLGWAIPPDMEDYSLTWEDGAKPSWFVYSSDHAHSQGDAAAMLLTRLHGAPNDIPIHKSEFEEPQKKCPQPITSENVKP